MLLSELATNKRATCVIKWAPDDRLFAFRDVVVQNSSGEMSSAIGVWAGGGHVVYNSLYGDIGLEGGQWAPLSTVWARVSIPLVFITGQPALNACSAV